MMSEKFSLKWTDFQSVVSQSFSVLRREEDFYDVTLVSDDETQIPAHKLVLAASSSFFKSILKRNSHSHPLLYLSGVDSKSLGFVMDYIYQGEVHIYQHDLDNFLDVAQRLRVEGLLSTGDTKQPKEEDSYFENIGEESFQDVPKSVHDLDEFNDQTKKNIHSVKTVSLNDMSEVDAKIEQLMERREGRHHCRACEYSSSNTGHLKEHVEIHIEGLSYACQFCDKTFRSRNVLRNHSNRNHS